MSHSDSTADHTGPVTLRTVADKAGVSISTASRALNGQARKYRISESTEEAVRKVATDLGFQPSQIARSLRLQRSEMIGVIVPDISNPFFAAIAREVSLGAEAEGFSVILADSREQTGIEERLAQQLRARQVEALLVCPVGKDSKHLIKLDQSGLPVVVTDRIFENTSLWGVTSDNSSAAQDVAQTLIAQGHRKIGVLSGVPESLPARARLAGLRETAQAAGIEIPDSHVAGNAFSADSGYVGTKELLSRHPEITALFSMCSPSAIGAIRALKEAGHSVPDDMSIVAFDDLPFAELLHTPLTVSVQDTKQLGKVATEVLMNRLKPQKDGEAGNENPPTTLTVQTKLIERESVAPPRQGPLG